jgi:high affinity Mn2+ porin
MSRRSTFRLVSIVLLAVLMHDSARELMAADIAVIRKQRRKAPPSYDWSGFYFGGHVAYSRSKAHATLADSLDATNYADPSGSTNPFVGNFASSHRNLYGGIQLGYNFLLPSRLLIGVEADASFPNYLAADDVAWSRITIVADTVEKIDYLATVRGRLGYAFPLWMVYATGGRAWANGRFLQTPGATDDINKVLHMHRGWALGAGAELAIERNWTARLEYLYSNFGYADVGFPSGTVAGSSFDVHAVRLGLNYRPGSRDGDLWSRNNADSSTTQFKNWEIHGQTTYIQQGYPAFRSPYLGENSFTPWSQTRATWASGVFLNVRLWDGGELYYNPELAAGVWIARYDRRRRLSQRRGPEVEFCIPALQHVAALYATDLRVWWGAGNH